jgi:DNA-binding transcriptional LysR family regulator
MDIRQLRCFVAAAELLNFTRAAEKLRVAQPALSRQIRSLEEDLGLQLLERDSRRVALTPAGIVFLPDAREILEQVEAAESRIKRFHREARQTISFGYPPTLAGPGIPRFVRRVAELAPKFQLDLRDLSNREMLDGVRERTLDAALLPDAAVPRSELFVAEPLGPIRFDVVFPSGHALSRRRTIDVADLSHEDLIVYDRKAYADYWLLLRTVFTAAKRPLIVSAEVDGGGTLMASVASGQGVAIVAHTMRDSAGPGLAFRPLRGETSAFRLALVVHRDLPKRTAGWLRQACREIFHSS